MELPPPVKSSWIPRVDFMIVALVLILVAWSFGGYINAGWQIASQAERINLLQNRINQQDLWMKQIEDSQKKANEEASKLLSDIKSTIAEIKGATNARVKR